MKENLKILVQALIKSKFWIIVMILEVINFLLMGKSFSFTSFAFFTAIITYIFGIGDIIEKYKGIKKAQK
ncbi:MAG: hypothetical protein RSC10_04865 [Longicatena sp.]